MRRLRFISVVLFLLASVGSAGIPAGAVDTFLDAVQFQENNPDGRKFEFLRDYLSGLKYLWLNERRITASEAVDLNAEDARVKLTALSSGITTSNVNLRMVRNLIDDYYTPENGLMLKASDLFIKTCEQQILFNNKEKEIYDQILSGGKTSSLSQQQKEEISAQLIALSDRRKESLKGMLEASFLVRKVIVSSQADRFGEFVTLAVTRRQREQLMARVKDFVGEGFEGELREGQSFVEASVVVIREILEDPSWQMLDG